MPRNERPLHGSRYRYRKGCHCDECTAANRAYWDAENARRRPNRGKAKTGPKVVADHPVRCSCGEELPSRTALGAHTWEAHDRPPTNIERRPLPPDTLEAVA